MFSKFLRIKKKKILLPEVKDLKVCIKQQIKKTGNKISGFILTENNDKYYKIILKYVLYEF